MAKGIDAPQERQAGKSRQPERTNRGAGAALAVRRATAFESAARRAGQIAPSLSGRNLSIHFRRLNMSK